MTSKRRARHFRTLRIIRQVTTPVNVTRARTPTAMAMSTRSVTTSMTLLLRTDQSTLRFLSILSHLTAGVTAGPKSPDDRYRRPRHTRHDPGQNRLAATMGSAFRHAGIRSRQRGVRDEPSDQVVWNRHTCARRHHDAGDGPTVPPGVGDRQPEIGRASWRERV